MIEYSADRRTAYFMGYKFRRDSKTGYYLANRPTYNGHRERLHVFVWRINNGEVPEGYHIHHMDEDKGNNEIENLACVPGNMHRGYHSKKFAELHPDVVKANMGKAQAKASEWHRSVQGRAWHSKHMQEQVFDEREYTCEYCGKRFKALPYGAVKYCSNGCKAKARYRAGLDNEERACAVCGKVFTVNKYSRTQCCSRECAATLRWDRIHQKRGQSSSL